VQSNAGSYGGAIYSNSQCDIFAINCTFRLNTAIFDGGAIDAGENSHSTWINITCSTNSAYGDGGCFKIEEYADVYIENSTITGNQAESGAGISAVTGSHVYSNDTIFRFGWVLVILSCFYHPS
jgi:predicted outer membrane repeat protein